MIEMLSSHASFVSFRPLPIKVTQKFSQYRPMQVRKLWHPADDWI